MICVVIFENTSHSIILILCNTLYTQNTGQKNDNFMALLP